MEKTTTEILRKHFDADNSVDEYAIVKAMQEYASQFKTNTDLITTEICVLRERVAELETTLNHSYHLLNEAKRSHNPTAFKEALDKIESLINKGK